MLIARFKLHLIINDKGEILNFMYTLGNITVFFDSISALIGCLSKFAFFQKKRCKLLIYNVFN